MFPFLASCLVFILFLSMRIHHSRKVMAEQSDSFWEKEAKANNTRKQPLDDLTYITIPLEDLPMNVLTDHPQAAEYHRILQDLSEQPIVDLSGITNTDLKLRYGAANLEQLSRYDQAYTMLVRTLQQWASLLIDENYQAQAVTVLEYAVSIGSDVSGTYRLLSGIYHETGNPDGILDLITKAEALRSPMKASIIKQLRSLIF